MIIKPLRDSKRFFLYYNMESSVKRKIENYKIKSFMIKNPFVVEENTLASDVLYLMNKKKITNVCVYKKGNKRKITGVLHIHNLLNSLK